jgi:hypothetical protein
MAYSRRSLYSHYIFIRSTYHHATVLGVTPNQQLQLSFAGGCFFALLAALSYVTRAPDAAQLLISIAMFLNVAGAILSRTCGDM